MSWYSAVSHFLLYFGITGKCISHYIFCTTEYNLMQVCFSTYFTIVALSFTMVYLNFLTLIMMFDLYRKQMKLLRTAMGRLEMPGVTDDEKQVLVNNFLSTYKKLCDNLEGANSVVKFMLSMTIIMSFARILAMIFYILVHVRELTTRSMALWFLELVFGIGVTLVLPILVEATLNEYDEIRLILGSQLLQYKDKKLQRAIYDALDYMEVRSANYYLWNLIPMDITLFINFVSQSVAYVIALLQFTF